MFEVIKAIIKRLFGRQLKQTPEEYTEQCEYERRYMDIEDINFTAIFANKLSTLTVSESTVNITDKNGEANIRTDLLNRLLSFVWDKSHKITSQALGKGGVILMPYVANNEIYTDIVPQNRFYVNSIEGEKITSVTVLADEIKRENIIYRRYTDYTLENGNYVIKNRATKDDRQIELDQLAEWANMPEEITITGVEKMLFGWLKCPIDNRRSDYQYGVSITFGCENILKQINDCLKQVEQEYINKKGFIGIDVNLTRLNAVTQKREIPKDGVFLLLNGDKEDLWKEFSPVIRETSYYTRLMNLFELLEKSVGTAKGILTEPVTAGATATEIKRTIYDTYTLVESIRKNWVSAVEDLVYTFNVLANAFKLAPQSDYQINWDWSYAMVESSSETWAQLLQGKSEGVVREVEMRQYLYPNETLKESQSAIDEIKANTPNLTELIGKE